MMGVTPIAIRMRAVVGRCATRELLRNAYLLLSVALIAELVWGIGPFSVARAAAQNTGNPTALALAPLAGTASTPVFTVIKQGANPWPMRMRLTFTNTAQSEDLVNFPVLVVLNSDRIDYSQTQDAGQDIRFTDPDGALLPYEIDRWDESGDSYVWVRVPQIDGSSNSDSIWMYYGNPAAADGQDASSVWAGPYRMVYHLEEIAGPAGVIRDSTANGFNATNAGSTDAAGYIGNARDFNGSDQYVNLGADLPIINGASAATLSAWVRADMFWGTGNILALSINNGGAPTDLSRASMLHSGWKLRVLARSLDDDTDPNDISTADYSFYPYFWHYVVAVVDYANDAVTFYVDGAPQAASGPANFAQPTTPATNSTSAAMGSNCDGSGSFLQGGIDEARVAATARSADWVSAEYKSMTDSFVAFGSQENLNTLAGAGTVGAPFTYTLTITNSGTLTGTNVVVTDTLPAGANYISGGVFIPGSNAVSWTVPAILPGSSVQVSFAVSTCQSSLFNKAYQVITSTQQIASPPGPAQLSLLMPPAIEADFEYRPLTVTAGSVVTFTSVVTTNGGPLAYWRWDLGDGHTASGPNIQHTYFNPGVYTLTLGVTDTCGFAGTVTKTMPVHVPDLVITKRVEPQAVKPGEVLTYTIAFSNTGKGIARGVVITDIAPIELINAGVISSGVAITYTGANPAYVWQVQDLAAGSGGMLTLTGVVSAGLPTGYIITNTAAIATLAVEPHTANNTSSAWVTVLNAPPVAVDDTYQTGENTPLQVTSLGVLSNDLDLNGDPLTAVLNSLPVSGALALNVGGSFVYTPALGFHGVDSFTYHADDGMADSNQATVVITVTAVNHPPRLAPIGAQSVHEGSLLTFTATASDADVPPNRLMFSLDAGAPAGANITADGLFSWTPGEAQGPGMYTVTVRVTDNGVPPLSDSETCTITVSPRPLACFLYAPLVVRNYVDAPDLIVQHITVTSNTVQVVIKNQGSMPVTGGFWVDLYVDPDPVPTSVNQIWSDGRSDQGIAWAVNANALPALVPGGALTLTIGDAYYQADLSDITLPLPAGTPVYAQADSANYATTYGAVLENHEIAGGPYNNIMGPVYSPAAMTGEKLPEEGGLSAYGEALKSTFLPRR